MCSFSPRCNVVDELIETRAEFQKFINRTRPFCPGESDYLIPDVTSIDIAKYVEKKERKKTAEKPPEN